MERVIAIGDIHGEYKKLRNLLDQISPSSEDRLIFLGDLIDRGPESYQVVEFINKLKQELPKTIILFGNHDAYVLSLMLGKFHRVNRTNSGYFWPDGGRQTMASYDRAGIPLTTHFQFFKAMRYTFQTDNYFFCHAGVKPGIPLDKQAEDTLIHITAPFLSSKMDFGKIVIHGHATVKHPDIRPNRINIDTGACNGGPLTALALPSQKIWQSKG